MSLRRYDRRDFPAYNIATTHSLPRGRDEDELDAVVATAKCSWAQALRPPTD